MTRFETLFCLRYAVRVLERHARLWDRVDALIRVCALLAGSGAVAALMAEHRAIAVGLGVAFAVLQAVEFGVRPAERAARSRAARRAYADVLSAEAGRADADLEAAYQTVVAGDEVVVPEALRAVAYNDVARERGVEPRHLFVLDRWQRLVARLA